VNYSWRRKHALSSRSAMPARPNCVLLHAGRNRPRCCRIAV